MAINLKQATGFRCLVIKFFIAMRNISSTQKKLNGKTVVITGASSGVGKAVAEAFAKEGCHLVLAARGEEALNKAVEDCMALGARVLGVSIDVSDYDEVNKLLNSALAFTGVVDVWVNNAGVMASGKFEEIPIAVSQQVIKTNLMGYMHGAHAVLPVFKKQGYGILINNVSIGGFMPAPYSAVYSSTKFGIKGMMTCLQAELSNRPDIHICNIYPQIQRSTGNMHSAKYSGLDFKIPPFASDPRDTANEILKLAKHPQKDKFPDFSSWMIKTAYGLFPKTILNTASAGMRLLMKVKNAPPDAGNILNPSTGPHRVYGETIIPSASKRTKAILAMGTIALLGVVWLAGRPKE